VSITYSYTCLRYIHDVATGEFANVGVLVYAPEARYAKAICRTTYRRLTTMFPSMDGKAFRSLMSYIQNQFAALGEQIKQAANDLPLDRAPKSVLMLAHTILPADDSSLQWSPPHGGVTDDPEAALQRIYTRMVACYDETPEDERRNDEDIWRAHRTPLEAGGLLARLQSKTVTADDDEYEFKRTWSNGHTNCIEPLSFDLVSPSSFNGKAHRWLGLTTSLGRALDNYHLYLILGEPQATELRPPFEKAVRILEKISVRHSLIPEKEAENFLKSIAPDIEKHSDHTA